MYINAKHFQLLLETKFLLHWTRDHEQILTTEKPLQCLETV